MGIDGIVDCVTNDHVDGWVYRDDDPSEHLAVTVQLGGVDIGSATTNQFREDLKDANIGEGDHAYFINLDRRLDDSEFDQIVVLALSQDGQRAELLLPAASASTAENSESAVSASDLLLRNQLEKTLKYSLTYADASELLPPVGYPVDFIDDNVLAEAVSWIQTDPAEMRERIGRDLFPIPHLQNREGYSEGDDLGYWLSGYADYRMIQGIAAEHGVKGGRYFDFGGSTGRVFRHFAIQTDAWDVWSCDFKVSTVEFNLKYFPPAMRVFLNTSFPALPLPDSYFDLISACSVFTHIDEAETGWLLELRRILKIGGIACISIHNKNTWMQMTGDLRDDVVKFRPDIADQSTLPAGKTVVTFRNDDPYRCHTFHSDEYIRRNWGRFLEICEVRPLVLGLQAMVVCRRVD
jgi:ubiquinone/menaquinone biosynthesis C-methylase UbiE